MDSPPPKSPTRSPGPKHSWRAEALAFHPDGKRLAVAGGDNHEVRLWDLGRQEKLSEIRSVTLDRRGNLLVTENDIGFVRIVFRKP